MTHMNKVNNKATLKLLLIILPIFGLLVGIGLGLILGVSKFESTFDLYVKVGTILLPSISILIIAFSYFFKKIDTL